MADPNEFVFPQTITPDKNFNREGGLTKRQYIATKLLGSCWLSGRDADQIAQSVRFALTVADELIRQTDANGEKN